MKNILFAISILTIFCFAKCKKDKTDFNGLPAATQSGKNMLGFLLNGQPWTPKGFNGTANLSIDFDEGVKNGICGISAYRIIPADNREYFKFGIVDSLNYFTAPFTIPLTNSGLCLFYFSNYNCLLISNDSDVEVSGYLNVNKLDRTNRIISGTFNATMSKIGCTPISITEGRFDMKF